VDQVSGGERIEVHTPGYVVSGTHWPGNRSGGRGNWRAVDEGLRSRDGGCVNVGGSGKEECRKDGEDGHLG